MAFHPAVKPVGTAERAARKLQFTFSEENSDPVLLILAASVGALVVFALAGCCAVRWCFLVRAAQEAAVQDEVIVARAMQERSQRVSQLKVVKAKASGEAEAAARFEEAEKAKARAEADAKRVWDQLSEEGKDAAAAAVLEAKQQAEEEAAVRAAEEAAAATTMRRLANARAARRSSRVLGSARQVWEVSERRAVAFGDEADTATAAAATAVADLAAADAAARDAEAELSRRSDATANFLKALASEEAAAASPNDKQVSVIRLGLEAAERLGASAARRLDAARDAATAARAANGAARAAADAATADADSARADATALARAMHLAELEADLAVATKHLDREEAKEDPSETTLKRLRLLVDQLSRDVPARRQEAAEARDEADAIARGEGRGAAAKGADEDDQDAKAAITRPASL